METLLGRPQYAGDLGEAAAWLAGRRVLVTGAAGSVGTPLSRVLAGLDLGALALVDHHEYSLFGLERLVGPATSTRSYELLDVRDTRRLTRLVQRLRPEVIIHLAAAKHVPYGERFPEGVVEANVLATAALIEAATSVGTRAFVYPSSDKSVDPPSLYGATKRLGEALVQKRAAQAGTDDRWVVARFVNIVGTRGSVIETFSQQVLDGAPLSVTDERMTRYWISMNEALWLVLQAGGRGRSGTVFMPDCGAAIPVLETARRLAAWHRPSEDPYPVHIVGVRPGERLDEVLLSRNETAGPSPATGVLAVSTRRPDTALDQVHDTVERLRRLVRLGNGRSVRQVAMASAGALQ